MKKVFLLMFLTVGFLFGNSLSEIQKMELLELEF